MLAAVDPLPLVTVICLCYNHENYVVASLQSVLSQSYKNIEIIIVNDYSTDNSKTVIEKWLHKNALNNIFFIDNEINLGHTKSFNKAYIQAKGKFIIDLATDDLLEANAIANHVRNFKKNSDAGVSFSNIINISEKGEVLNTFYRTDTGVPYVMNFIPKSGNLYHELLQAFYVNACGMCVKKEVYDFLNGYDETLDYEDFDFWVRSSFVYDYIYDDFISVKRRILETSHSSLAKTVRKNQYRKERSTFKVCVKAYNQNKTAKSFNVLKIRIIHEFKIAIKTKHISLAFKYAILYLKSFYKIKNL